ncbi:MAG: hypothetical protein HC788_15090 [Sphingopyxis sp.]|nr:hypothetical protein [Sphingopyxis sp.]
MSTAPSPDSPAPGAESSDPDLSGTLFDFTPVPMARVRAGGWSAVAAIDAKQCEARAVFCTFPKRQSARKVGFIGELW